MLWGGVEALQTQRVPFREMSFCLENEIKQSNSNVDVSILIRTLLIAKVRDEMQQLDQFVDQLFAEISIKTLDYFAYKYKLLNIHDSTSDSIW